MPWRAEWIVVVSAIASFGFSPPGEKAAGNFHEQAKQAYADGRFEEAIQLWGTAQRKHAYSVAMSSVALLRGEGRLSLATFAVAPFGFFSPRRSAGDLHARAKAAYGGRRFEKAAELWRAASRLHPTWWYAYGLAAASYENDQPMVAWEACARVEALEIPPQHVDTLTELKAKTTAALLSAGWSRISLAVDPVDARVERGGRPWRAPWSRWTKDERSRITVTRDRFAPREFVWEHAPGREYERTVELRRTAAPGTAGRDVSVVDVAPKAASEARQDPELIVAMPSDESA